VADIFISYSKQDRPVAEALANELIAHGFDVWWDFRLYAGDDFHDVILEQIRNARAVVVIWSDAAAASNWVRGEAQEAGDKLISTCVRGFNLQNTPLNFRYIHTEVLDNRSQVLEAIRRKVELARNAERIILQQTEAVRLETAAVSGDVEARYELGIRYILGEGVQKDEKRASQLLHQAAEEGFAAAQGALGAMYEKGRWVAKDEVKAIHFYRMAAEQGDIDAQFCLAQLFINALEEHKRREAVVLFHRAAGQGHVGAQFVLGLLYDIGMGGVVKDDKEAVRFYRLAAEQGNAKARNNLASYYAEGRGVAKDYEEAMRLYRLAADQGCEEARTNLSEAQDKNWDPSSAALCTPGEKTEPN
jgi:TPR repeat protein